MRAIGALIAIALALGAARPVRRDVKIDRDSAVLQFEYQWSAEAAAIPPLNRRLRTKAEAAYREAIANARADAASAARDKRPFHRHSFGVNWETAGRTRRLLSLEQWLETFTGGAHPNHGTGALLWDRRIGAPVEMAALFARPRDFAGLTRDAYCNALAREQRARRNGEAPDPIFADCPKYADLAIAPRDRDRDGRFEVIEFIAAPYLAGPYVDGEYGIAVPVTPRMIAAMKPPYRASFEAQRQ